MTKQERITYLSDEIRFAAKDTYTYEERSAMQAELADMIADPRSDAQAIVDEKRLMRELDGEETTRDMYDAFDEPFAQ